MSYEENLPCGVTQAMIDRLCDGDEIRCGVFIKRLDGTHRVCGSEDFSAEMTCQGEFELTGEPCRYKYAVPVQWNGFTWATVGSSECPICHFDDSERTGVVCAKCGNEAPEYCTDCGSIPCHCNPFDAGDDL